MRVLTFLFTSLLLSSAAYAAEPTPIGNEDCGKILSTDENDTFIITEDLVCSLEDGEAALTIESGVTLLGQGILLRNLNTENNTVGLRIVGNNVSIIDSRTHGSFTTGIEVLGNNVELRGPVMSYTQFPISVGDFTEANSNIHDIKIFDGDILFSGKQTTPIIRLHNVEDVEITNMKIWWDYPPADTGIVFTGENKNVWVHKNEVKGMLSINNGHNFLVEHNTFGTSFCYSDLVHDFISLSGESSENTITNNLVYGSSGHGISLSRGSISNTVTNNQVYRSAKHNLYDDNIECVGNDWRDNTNDNNDPIHPVCASE